MMVFLDKANGFMMAIGSHGGYNFAVIGLAAQILPGG
jgi:hypothetical protein